MRTSLRTAIRLTLALAVGISASAVKSAGAVNVPDRTAAGVVWYLGSAGQGSIETMWRTVFTNGRLPYSTPNVYWYNRWDGDHYQASCASTADWPNNGFACPGGNIYLDKRYMERLTATFGDYAVGGFLAHEWGHHVQSSLGYGNAGHRSEYHADCLAGIYTRYGYANGRLSGGDYWEFHNWLMSQPSSPSHGTAQNRAAWYRYGYDTYSIASCNLAFR
jgi:predicted metalloprotease